MPVIVGLIVWLLVPAMPNTAEKPRLNLKVAEQKHDTRRGQLSGEAASGAMDTGGEIRQSRALDQLLQRFNRDQQLYVIPPWHCRENVIEVSRDHVSSSRKCQDLRAVAGK